MARDPYRYFRVEARELVDALGQGALDLAEGRGAPGLVDRLLRLAHTLKGAARVVRQEELAALAHAVEDQLAPHRGAVAAPATSAREVLRAQGRMGALLAALDAPAPAPDAQPGAREAAPAIAVDVEDVDAIGRLLLEQSTEQAALRAELEAVERASRLAAVLADQLRPRGGQAGDRAGPGARALGLAEDLRASLARVRHALTVGSERLERGHGELRSAAERLRLAPAGALFAPLEGAAREAALALGKRVELVASGGENRLDVGVLGPLRQALIHVVRNAVAHGIESPGERAAAGKPPAGRVELRVERRGLRLAFACRDDGRGIDVPAVRRAAVERGVVSAAEAERLRPEGALRLALHPGVTTSGAVSEVAGRGVGLDVVREVAARLQGEVAISSDPGAGTTVELCVPVTLSSLAALVVEVGGERVALPLAAVRRTFRLAPRERARPAGELVLDGAGAVPFAPLAAALRPGAAPGPEPARASSAVSLEAGAGRAAVGVDRLRGVETVLVRPLPPLTPPCPLAAGVFLDAGGAPHLVLEAEALVEAVRARAGGPATPDRPERPPVLVIDDSLTTRMLEQSILESAGYHVEVAVTAEEGLVKAGERRYGLFVVDVEMPGMDGFEFVRRTRADPVLRQTPAILVTSRGSPKDRQRGEEAGASAYIVKSEFDQAHLLRTIRDLAG